MATVTVPGRAGEDWLPATAGAPAPGRLRRLVRGREDDPAWVRPCLVALLVATGVLYLWGLGASGWANSFYAAAVQAGTKSWKALFFGSFDAGNFITVDKPPAALWVMDLSARLFGVNAWSLLVPQALEGVATVGVLYATVRRWFSPGAALLAGAVAATTPVAALMFRFNNPDALLALVLTLAAYATVRAIETAGTRWLVAAGALVGLGFITKMLQAMVVVPALALAYLLAAPTPFWRRARQLLAAGVALVTAAGWWVAAVQLTPAADRPYIGGSQNNSLLNLVFGYNGFGRLTGNETGSVGGGPRAGSRWGLTGLTRLFGADMATQVSWLLPAALILLVAGVVLTLRAARTDRLRAALVIWGGTLLIAGAVFSFGQGIIHPYYTVALAPSIGALVGIGAAAMWQRRDSLFSRTVLAGALVATVAWSYELLRRTPRWHPWLRDVDLVAGVVLAGLVVLWTRRPGRVSWLIASGALIAALAGAGAYTLATASTPHSGAIPSAGPTLAQAGGRPGGIGFRGPGRFAFGPGGGFGGFAGPGGAGVGGALPGGGAVPGNGAAPAIPGTGNPRVGSPGFGFGRRFGRGRGGFGGGFFPGGGPGGGGLLNGSRPSAAVTAGLKQDASRYTWVAATVGANEASGYQLATGDPVMAIGGFNGTDPAPALAAFEADVRAGRIHYFIPGGFGRGAGVAGQITSWVESNFGTKSIGGATFYDLTAPLTNPARLLAG